ncbi:MAG TPA: hypothetical protein VFB38_21910 [Chthonomonadaceae bacterium]|nr:hypothetical protein [Chthonomonadaceae bacterium]
MKQQVHPAVVAIAVGLVLVIIGYFYMREMGNVGRLGPLERGNPGPFSPGGAAVSKKSGVAPPARVGSPGPGGAPGKPGGVSAPGGAAR